MPNRVCQQCGTPLAPGQDFCGKCGAYYSEPGAAGPTQRASSYPGAITPETPLPPTQYVAPSSRGAGTPGAPIPPTQYAASPYENNPYAPPPPPSNVPYAGTPYAQQQFGAASYGQPLGGFPQTPTPKKGPNVGLIIGIVALLVIVVGAGIFFVTRLAGGNTRNTGNSTPIPVGTGPTGVATPQALFTSKFTDNTQGWTTGNNNGYSRNISNNQLTLSDSTHQILIESLPINNTFNDFSVTANFTFGQGDQNDGIGLYVRGDSNLDHDYRIEVFGDNTYAIVKEYLDSSKNAKIAILVNPVNAPSLHPVGQENKMTVIMKGSTLVLLINDTLVNTITDHDYTNGQIALFVQNGNSSNGVTGSFSSVSVYPAPDQLPG